MLAYSRMLYTLSKYIQAAYAEESTYIYMHRDRQEDVIYMYVHIHMCTIIFRIFQN